MTIKVYVNDDYEVISENQYKKLIDKKIAELDRNELRNLFDKWFNLPYDREYEAYDLLVFDAEKREHILAEFTAWASIAIAEKFEKVWYETELEL